MKNGIGEGRTMNKQTDQHRHQTALSESVPQVSPAILLRRIRKLEEICWTLQKRVIELEGER